MHVDVTPPQEGAPSRTLGDLVRPQARPSQPVQPRVNYLKLNPDKLTQTEWQELRRFVGARRAAELTGLSEAEVIKRAGGGASRFPLQVEDEMNQRGQYR